VAVVSQFSRHREWTFDSGITGVGSLRYLISVPRGYGAAPEQRWPLLLFLHGAGERGDDLSLVARHGPPRVVEEGTELPFILVAPQCPTDERWSVSTLSALLDEVTGGTAADADRICVTGMSMGGSGTWELAAAYPHRFAAIAPICGRPSLDSAAAIAHLPIWTFHGAKDPVVPVTGTEAMVAALRRLGSTVRYTRYPDAAHDSWTQTYTNSELYTWLASHRRAREDADG
jgi:predicted peptidase